MIIAMMNDVKFASIFGILNSVFLVIILISHVKKNKQCHFDGNDFTNSYA